MAPISVTNNVGVKTSKSIQLLNQSYDVSMAAMKAQNNQNLIAQK